MELGLLQRRVTSWFLMTGVTRFEDLVVWQKARHLAAEIRSACEAGQGARDYALVNQLRRAAISVVANVAEGFERKRSASFVQFLDYARGSCAEVRAHLYLASDVGWLLPDDFARLMRLADEVGRMLGSLQAAQRRHR